MTIKIPQTKVTLCIKVNNEYHVHTEVMQGRVSLAIAKKHFADAANWCEEWQEVKVLEISKDSGLSFDIPVADLLVMCNNYLVNHVEFDEQKEG